MERVKNIAACYYSPIIAILCQIGRANLEIMIGIELPKLAVNDIEVFIRKELRLAVDIVNGVERVKHLSEAGSPELCQ